MEYLLLSLLAFPVYLIYRSINLGRIIPNKTKLVVTQARTYTLMLSTLYAQHIENMNKNLKLKTQATDMFDKQHVRVLILEDQAFWIENNAVYVSTFDNGFVDKENAQKLDTMGMNDVELKKMMTIVEQLTKGLNDEGNGNRNKDI